MESTRRGRTPSRCGSGRRTPVNPCGRVVNQRLVVETRGVSISWEESAGDPGYWAGGDRRIEGATLIQALVWNCGNQSFRCQGRSPSGNHHEASVPKRSTGTDRPVRARKAGNAARAKGSGQAVAYAVQLATGGNGWMQQEPSSSRNAECGMRWRHGRVGCLLDGSGVSREAPAPF